MEKAPSNDDSSRSPSENIWKDQPNVQASIKVNSKMYGIQRYSLRNIILLMIENV